MLKSLTNIGLVFVFFVIGLGALTRLLDAGLGCPDWPGCYGLLTPPGDVTEIQTAKALFPDTPIISHQAWMEMIHRYAAGALGIIILSMTIIAVRNKHSAAIKRTCIALCFIVVGQALFGMWTVTLKLWPPIVTLHLLGGFTTLSLLIILKSLIGSESKTTQTAGSLTNPMPAKKPFPSYIGALALIVLVSQITLGAWTSSNYAGLACPDFPTCQNQRLPDISPSKALSIPKYDNLSFLHGRTDAQTRVSIQYLHRIGALLTTLILLLFVFKLFKTESRLNKKFSIAMTLTLTLQITLGILSAIWLLPLSIALAHNLIAASLLALLVFITTHNLVHTVTTKEIEHGLVYHN